MGQPLSSLTRATAPPPQHGRPRDAGDPAPPASSSSSTPATTYSTPATAPPPQHGRPCDAGDPAPYASSSSSMPTTAYPTRATASPPQHGRPRDAGDPAPSASSSTPATAPPPRRGRPRTAPCSSTAATVRAAILLDAGGRSHGSSPTATTHCPALLPRRCSSSTPQSTGLHGLQAPLMEMATQPSSTAIESIPDELLWDILLRLPSPASLACAACASPRWRGIASNDSFLKAFRKKHPSSPLLGYFAPNLIFQTSRSVSKSPELAAMLRQADTALASFERDWRIRDCHNGRLLLSGADNQLCIYDPLSQRRVAIGQRTRHDRDHDWGHLDPCLLDGLARQMVTVQQRGQWKKAQESFRVISLQRLRHDSMVRAIEYTLELGWLDHPWAKVQSTDLLSLAMHAAGHIFWVTDCALPLLVLDTGTMEFSQHTLPREMEMDSARCAIGELRDVKGCLVCLQGHHHISSAILDPIVPLPQQPHSNVCLQVWALEKKGEGKEAQICWKLEKEVSVSRILGKETRVYKINKVVNGLAVIGCNYHALDQYVIDLQSMTVLSKFQYAGEAYPYQMSWPPAVLAAATSVLSSHKRVNLSNEESAQIPSNNRGGREGTSSRGSEPASLQSQLQEESPDVSGSSGIEDASRDIDNQHALASPGIGDAAHADVPTDDEPGGQRKKQKTNACPEVRQANPRATCWNSSMGQPTTQEKPLHKVPFVCHVDGCTESYASKFELNRHLSAHGVEFFCPYCERDPFKYRHSLNRHVMEVHEQNKRFPCTECDMKFPRSCHLVRHVKALHQSTRSFTCGFRGCSEEFPSRRAKNQHEQSSAHVEPGTKKIKCHFKDCTQTFTERCSCNRHYKSLHERTAPSH